MDGRVEGTTRRLRVRAENRADSLRYVRSIIPLFNLSVCSERCSLTFESFLQGFLSLSLFTRKRLSSANNILSPVLALRITCTLYTQLVIHMMRNIISRKYIHRCVVHVARYSQP